MNRDHPESPTFIVCRGADGAHRNFSPTTYRSDVVEATGIDGVFGFAIPVDLLAPLGPVVTVTDANDRVLKNGKRVVVPGRCDSVIPDAPVNIFLHIPKTAGTGLRNTLLRTVPPGEVALIYPGASPGLSADRFDQVPAHQRARLGWVFGHCQYGIHELIDRPAQYITFIRDPKARLRSNVAHHIIAGTVFHHDGRDIDLATAFNENLSEEFDNVMTRVIAGRGQDVVPLGQMGEAEVAHAIDNVRNHFSFVGQQSWAGDDTAILQRQLGLPEDPLAEDNVTASLDAAGRAIVRSLDWAGANARNGADQALVDGLVKADLLSRTLR